MRPAAFPLEELYRSHRRRAVGLAHRVLCDPGEAEDVVQEVFARLFVAPPSFSGLASHATWLHRVVLNRSLNALRARSRRTRLELLPHVPHTPEEWLSAKEHARRFLDAWRQLGDRHQALVWMRDVQGLDYREMGKRLGIREGTVKSALSRGRACLRALLLLHGPDGLAPRPAER